MKTKIYISLFFILHSSFFILSSSAQVTADFSSNVTSGCSPLVVVFSDQSTGNPASWNWNLGNGNNSTLQNPGATYVTPGTYTVTLTASNGGSNDTETKTAYITVFANPVADFNSNIVSGCLPLTVNFTDNSTPGSGAINSWFWDFGDGFNSTQQNPSHTYTSQGNFTVSLIVTDVNGCTNSITKGSFINAFNGPTANFSASPTSSCSVPFNVSFNSTSTGTGLTYQWNFTGGSPSSSTSQNPSVTYNSSGSFNVSLTVTDGGGCQSTFTQNNFINIIDANFTATPLSGCTPLTVNFTNTSLGNPSTFQWNFGDAGTSSQQNPSHTYNTPGTYTVTLTAGNGTCNNVETKTNLITVGTMPSVDFSANDTVPCQVPTAISFTDNTAGAVLWQWDFGDAGTSTQQNPSHTYTAEGIYDVTLIVTVANGCKDTLEKTAYINLLKPDAIISADTTKGCAPLTVQFSDSSSSGSPIVSWSWDFDDGNTSTSQNPSNTFTDTGKYNVILNIVNSKGCVDSDTMQITVGQKPTADFSGTPLSGCQPLEVDFTDNSSNFTTNWFWSFGDGGTDNTENPTHTYEDTGTFDVTLVVSNNGCLDTLFKNNYITVFPPKAIFSVLPGTIGCSVPFTVALQEQSQDADTWFWDFGNGTTFTGQNPDSVTYTTGGTYTIKLVVTNIASGCTDSTTQIIRISAVNAAFSVSGSGCQPLLATFADASSSPFGVRNWQWNFGDSTNGVPNTLDNLGGQLGTTSVPNGTHNFLTSGTYQNPIHTYMLPGTYSVTLTVTDQLVCTQTIVMTNIITVNQIPTVNFESNQQTGCPPFDVQFTDLSTSSVGMAQWSWSFGDGDSSFVQNPVHTYLSSGASVDSFTVILIATDSNGCVSGIVRSKYIIVRSPTAGFFSNTGSCIGISQLFTDTSTASNPIASWYWDFGDGTSDTVQNPIHTYGSSGVFDVTLAITDTAGCVDTIIKANYMTVQSVTANFGANPTNKNCPPLNVQFSDSSLTGIVAWLWDFGDGNTSTLQNPSHLYNSPGEFDVSLIVTTSLGCKDTILKPDLINIDGPTGEFILFPDTGCPGTDVTFDTLNVENAISFTWDFGDGNLGTGTSDTNTYSQVGIYHPFLIFQDVNGCSFAVQGDSIVITNIPVNAGPDITICEGDSGTLNASGGSIFNWNPSAGLSATNIFNPSASPADTTKYYVQITRSDGCTNNDSVTVFVKHNVPAANFSATSVCKNEITDFNDLSTIPGDAIISWSWNFNNSEGISTDTNPSFTFSSNGNFDVELLITANNGCVDSVTKLITVFALPIANAGNDTAICIGKTAPLSASGGVNYAWFSNATLSDTSIANPLAEPTSATTYFVIVSDMNSCKDTDSVTVSINQLPVADAGNDLQICRGDSTQLSASGGIIYAWNFNSTLSDTSIANPFANPADTTKYYVSVTDNNGCVNMDSVEIIVNPNFPNANFSADTVCKNLATNFTNSSNIIGDTVVSWNWNFNNGEGISTDTNPNFVFSSGGNFNVFLEITTNIGCKDTITKTIRVHPLPTPNAGADDTICVFQTAQLSASGGANYQWNSDTTLSDTSIKNPVAIPQITTDYVVFVTDSNNCINSDTVTVLVSQLPNANAGSDLQICLGDSTQLSASGGIKYEWNSNPTLSNDSISNPVVKPADTTMYIVTVTDSNGCMNKDTVVITVNPNFPNANFSAASVCEENATNFTNSSSIVGDAIVSWNWNFNNGEGFSTDTNPDFTFSDSGNFSVLLIIITNHNCTDTISKMVRVNPKPDADFIVNDNCFGEITIFKDTSKGNNVIWFWDFDDGTNATTSLNIPYPHLYSDTGTYDVSLNVQTDSGCTDVIIKTVEVYPAPDAGFIFNTVCLNEATSFNDTSAVIGSAVIDTWNWDFGDGGTDNVQSPTHTFNTEGTFLVKLVVATNSGQCKDSIVKDVTVNPLPQPQCNASPVETDINSPKINFSTNDATTYLWDFAGLDTSSLNNPQFSFPDSGIYTVILTQTNNFGCSDTCNIDIYIKPVFEMKVPNAFTPNPDGANGGDYFFNPFNNDVFFPITRYVTEFQMLIYNRWGELLFVSNDIKVGWDGYYRGKLCAQDVYVWKIKATFATGDKITKAGDVSLIR